MLQDFFKHSSLVMLVFFLKLDNRGQHVNQQTAFCIMHHYKIISDQYSIIEKVIHS